MKPNTTFFLLLSIVLFISSSSLATRPGSSPADKLKHSNSKGGNNYGGGVGPFFGGPGGGFSIPGFGNGYGNGVIPGGAVGGGYGSGYGGPNGGYSKGGVIRPSVVCKDRGPCFQKKVTCPAKCFTSFSRSGKGYGAGGGGGGCTIDCKKKCTAYC